MVVPREVEPSNTATLLPISAVPVRLITFVVSTPPVLGENAVITGAGGGAGGGGGDVPPKSLAEKLLMS